MEKLKETAKAYTEKYPERLKQFLNENEADKSDYIKRESEYFENTLWDLENRDEILYHIDALLINNSPNGFSLTGIENLNMACDLGNQIGFDKLMDSIKKKVKFLESEKPLPHQQPETETEQGTPIFTNNFDKITPTEIYKHFKAGLVEKQYLTEQELNEYLKAAFELKTIPKTLFKIKDTPNKAAIEAVFYKYYKNVAGKIHGKQNQYAALLGDYFEGYKTTTVSSNFSKSVY